MAMSSIKKVKVLALLLILLLNLSGCKKETGVIECPFFGTWRIEKVAEISEEYVGMELGGEDLYDAAVFVGCELEYKVDGFMLDGTSYNSKYVITYQTVEEFQKSVPDFYTFLDEEEIEINDRWDDTAEMLLLKINLDFRGEILYPVTYGYRTAPAEIHCVLLNKNTMIVKVWNKFLLAYRSE